MSVNRSLNRPLSGGLTLVSFTLLPYAVNCVNNTLMIGYTVVSPFQALLTDGVLCVVATRLAFPALPFATVFQPVYLSTIRTLLGH